LKGFCENGSFWVYDRYKSEFRLQTPINTTLEKDYYSFRKSDGSLDSILEDYLSNIEGKSSKIIEKVDKHENLNSKDKKILTQFISLMMFRVPEYKKKQRELRKVILNAIGDDVVPITKEELINMKGVSPENERIPAFELVQEIKKIEESSDLSQNEYIKSIIPNAEMVSNYFLQMSWVIIESPQNSGFITTDSPLQTIPPPGYKSNEYTGYGIATEGVTNIFPLSRNKCLAMFGYDNFFSYLDFDRDRVRDFNVYLASSCDRFLIGPNENQIRHLVKRAKIDIYNKAFRIRSN
jgi:hypothetical protein